MDSRSLTEEEEAIIQKRVQAQQDMLREYEKRDRKRKVEEIRSVVQELTVEQAEQALELCDGNEDVAMEELTENSRFRRKIFGKSVPKIQQMQNRSERDAPTVPLSLDGSVFVGSFRGKSGSTQERASAEPGNQSRHNEISNASGNKGTKQSDEGCERIDHCKTLPHDPNLSTTRDHVLAKGPRRGCNSIKNAENEDQCRGNLQTDCAAPGPSCSLPDATPAAPELPRLRGSSKSNPSTNNHAGTKRENGREGAVSVVGSFKSARPPRRRGSSASMQVQAKPSTSDGDSSLPRQTNARLRSGSSSSPKPLPKVSIRCINCQKAKRGHCGTERAIKSCLRRSNSRVAPQVELVEPSREAAPGKGWRKTGQTPSIAWLQYPFTTLGSERLLAEEYRGRRGRTKDTMQEEDKDTQNRRIGVIETQSTTELNCESFGIDCQEEHLNRRLPLTLGRKRQKACKNCELVQLGKLQTDEGWFNAGYIFPDGLHTRTVFRSSVMVDQLVVHDCFIIGEGGQYWPKPTFRIVAADRPQEPLEGRSCTACWTGILHRINSEINRRREAGEDLPPPPRTAIAGPEYFGLCHPEIIAMYEALDVDKKCTEYWQGKNERIEYAKTGILVPRVRKVRPQRERRPDRRRARTRRVDEFDVEAYFQEEYTVSRWSSLSRNERYKRRNGGLSSEDHPLPGFIDPITLEEVVNPAISPDGHVMGYATWVAVLSESAQCPFTKKPLSREHLVKLTKANFERYHDRIIYQ
uniref:U-box domain-containing protein n=1 Tax=Picocystis salinarum TaxID=88271 RepID=A0A7S3XCB6_9CHLO